VKFLPLAKVKFSIAVKVKFADKSASEVFAFGKSCGKIENEIATGVERLRNDRIGAKNLNHSITFYEVKNLTLTLSKLNLSVGTNLTYPKG
jgi:hypothetical protein